MRYLQILLIMILIPACLAACLTRSPYSDFEPTVLNFWNGWISEGNVYTPENPAQSSWKLSYHPIIYFAWEYKGNQSVNRNLENQLRELDGTYWTLDQDLTDQVAEGNTSFDRERFLALIEDEQVRERTSTLIDEGVTAIYAYARAAVEPLKNAHPDLPEQVLRLLGKLYETRNDLLEVPTTQPVVDEDTKWRDWLHTVLAATGSDGVWAILDWDKQIENLQIMAPDQPFWDGRLTHAMTLRSLQLARSSALGTFVSDLAQYDNGGVVSGLARWMYWDLAKTAWEKGGMFPYTEGDVSAIVDFLIEKGLLNGPMSEGGEARSISDALGRAPSMDWINELFRVAELQTTPQERRDLCYSAIAKMLQSPDLNWLTNSESAGWLKEKILAGLDNRSLIGNAELLELYAGVLLAFQSETARRLDVELTHDDLMRIHSDFIAFMRTLTDTDECAAALRLFQWGIMQPDFTSTLEDSTVFFGPLTEIYNDWGQSTTFENSVTSEEEFGIIYRYFGRVLGIGIPWDFITGGDGVSE
ncbi:MAG: hypothetical protein NTY09_05000 [bacterium]|nr:hypothetical protein [bacterium]